MPLKTLSLNKGLLQHFSNHIMMMSLINIICTFLLIPFSYIMMTVTNIDMIEQYQSVHLGADTFFANWFYVGTMLYAVISGLMMTYFLKSEEASDFFHSLKFRRGTLLAHIVVVFMTHLIINLMINGALTWLLSFYYSQITLAKIGQWMMVTIIIATTIFFLTLFIGQWVNNYYSHLGMTLLIIILPWLLSGLIQGTYVNLFNGLSYSCPYNSQNIDDKSFAWTLPEGIIEQVTQDKIEWGYLSIVMFFGLLLLLCTYIIYRYRKNENVKNAFQSVWIEWIVGSLLTLIGMMIIGWIFSAVFRNIIMVVVIYLLAFIIIYIIFLMFNQKTVRVHLNLKNMFITLTVIAVVIGGIFAYGNWERQYVPASNEVASVSVMPYYYDEYSDELWFTFAVTDKSYIDEVRNLHVQLQTDKDTRRDDYSAMAALSYKMTDGREVNRAYETISEQQEHNMLKLLRTEKYSDVIAAGYNWKDIASYKGEINTPTNLMNNAYSTAQFKSNSAFYTAFRQDINKALLVDPLTKLSASSSEILLHSKTQYGNDKRAALSPYYHATIDYLINKGTIDRQSDIFAEGQFYQLTDPEDKYSYSSIDADTITKGKGVEIQDKTMRQALDNKHAVIDGKYAYVFINQDSYSLIYMDTDLTN